MSAGRYFQVILMEDGPSGIQGVLRRYTPEDWESLYKRLRFLTHKFYQSLPPRARALVSPDDLIHDSIADVILGRRCWPDDVAFEVFLCQVIRSKVSHLREKEGKVAPLSEVPPPPRPSHLYDDRIDWQRFKEGILALVSGNKQLTQIAVVWTNDPDLRPQEIAASLGLSRAEMRNAQKRLARKVASLRKT